MEGIEESLPRTQSAHTLKMILKQLRTGEITLEEYLMKCAYWGMKTLDDIYFMSSPSKSLEVIEFEQLPYYKKHRLTQEFFEDHPRIMRYYDQKRWIETMNKTSLLKMEAIKKYLPESDIENHKKLDERILDFKIKME